MDVKLAAARALQQLEPTNPRSYAQPAMRNSSSQQGKKILEWCLQAAQLGREQQRDYWTLLGAAWGIYYAVRRPAEVGQDEFEAFLDIFEHAGEAAMRRCRRLLPDQWVLPLAQMVRIASALVPAARQQLVQLQQHARSSSNAAAAAEARARLEHYTNAAIVAARGMRTGDIHTCDGCGQRALGLHRCARCQRLQYCRCVGPPMLPVQVSRSCLICWNLRAACSGAATS